MSKVAQRLAKLWPGRVLNTKVSHGSMEWSRPTRVKGRICAGTQLLDGLWKHVKAYTKPKRDRLADLPLYVRSWQWTYANHGTPLLAAFGRD